MGRGEPTAKEPSAQPGGRTRESQGEKEFKHHLPAALP